MRRLELMHTTREIITRILTLKPGLEPKPSPSPARAVDQGPAPSFREPEPHQAEPKPGHLSRAQPCTSLLIVVTQVASVSLVYVYKVP